MNMLNKSRKDYFRNRKNTVIETSKAIKPMFNVNQNKHIAGSQSKVGTKANIHKNSSSNNNYNNNNVSILSKLSLLSSKTSIGDSRISSEKFSRFGNAMRDHNLKEHKDALANTKK